MILQKTDKDYKNKYFMEEDQHASVDFQSHNSFEKCLINSWMDSRQFPLSFDKKKVIISRRHIDRKRKLYQASKTLYVIMYLL